MAKQKYMKCQVLMLTICFSTYFNLGKGNTYLIFHVCAIVYSYVSYYLYWFLNKYKSYREQKLKLNKLKNI